MGWLHRIAGNPPMLSSRSALIWLILLSESNCVSSAAASSEPTLSKRRPKFWLSPRLASPSIARIAGGNCVYVRGMTWLGKVVSRPRSSALEGHGKYEVAIATNQRVQQQGYNCKRSWAI